MIVTFPRRCISIETETLQLSSIIDRGSKIRTIRYNDHHAAEQNSKSRYQFHLYYDEVDNEFAFIDESIGTAASAIVSSAPRNQ